MTTQKDWWKDFFSGLIVEFWRAVFPPEATRAEADFFEKQLKLASGARVLDVPCGDGRLSVELAARGYRMTGVDISPEFLEAARASADGRGLTVAWRQSDMRDLPWTEEFEGAFCAGSSFGFLGDTGDAEFLRAVARSLTAGARLILDGVKAAEVILPNFRERLETEVGEIHFLAENRYEPATGTVENRYTISRGSRTETRVAYQRIYTYREVTCLVEAAGFVRTRAFGSLSEEPFRMGSPRLVLVAEKGR